jgi:hypothetical protein
MRQHFSPDATQNNNIIGKYHIYSDVSSKYSKCHFLAALTAVHQKQEHQKNVH